MLDKAHGLDDLGIDLIKIDHNLFYYWFRRIFNKTIETGQYLNKIKIAKWYDIY